MASPTTKVIRNARRRGVKIYNRRQWGNKSLVYAWRRKFRKHNLCPAERTDTVWGHISVTRRSNIKADMKILHSIGMERFKSGISYNFAIDSITGEVGLGQALDAAGTHTLNEKKKDVPNYSFNQNYVSFAFVFIGMPGIVPTFKAYESMSKIMAAMMEEGYLTRDPDCVPHRLVAAKECPTDPIANNLDRVLKRAKKEFKLNTGRTARQRKRIHKKGR